MPTEEGVACMNDALVIGSRAMSVWGEEDFNTNTEGTTYVFTVDHQVTVFTSFQEGDYPPDVRESARCNGPFRIGPVVCKAIDSVNPLHFIDVNALAWDGCPVAERSV